MEKNAAATLQSFYHLCCVLSMWCWPLLPCIVCIVHRTEIIRSIQLICALFMRTLQLISHRCQQLHLGVCYIRLPLLLHFFHFQDRLTLVHTYKTLQFQNKPIKFHFIAVASQSG